MNDIRSISNSEVGAWLKCRNSYMYYYDMGLAPLQESEALSNGSLMHSVLEQYYLAIKDGHKPAEAQGIAELWLATYMRQSNDYIGASAVAGWLAGYWPYAARNDIMWEILEVEKKYVIPITND